MELSVTGPITCARPTATLTATVRDSGHPVSVRWFDASEAMLGTAMTLDVSEAGTYTVRAQGGNGCTTEQSIQVVEDLEAPTVDGGPDATLTCATTESVRVDRPRRIRRLDGRHSDRRQPGNVSTDRHRGQRLRGQRYGDRL